MRKLLIIPLFLLFGCEIYEQPSSVLQQLSGPTPFYLKYYRIQIISKNDKTDIGRFVDVSKTTMESQFIGLGDWKVIGRSGDNYIIRCDTTSLSSHKKYIIGDKWSFGNPNIYGLIIYDNLSSIKKGEYTVYESSSLSNYTYDPLITITNKKTNEINPGFSVSTNSRGVAPATEIYITTPEQMALIKEGQRIIGRFNYSVELVFNRN
jgi:hypothetical protein